MSENILQNNNRVGNQNTYGSRETHHCHNIETITEYLHKHKSRNYAIRH